MLNRKLTLGLVLATPFLAVPALSGAARAAAPTQERQLKDSDLKKFASTLADYMEAKAKNKELVKAESEVLEELEKLEKKLKGVDPLSLSNDIGRALWLSADYAKARTKKGKVSEETYEESFFGDEGLTYAVWAPKDYDPKETSYPLIISIPDDNKELSTSEHIMQKWLEPQIRDNAILVAPTMPADVSRWSESGSPGDPGGLAYVLTTLKAITERYAVDSDRIYLAGRGAGVEAALRIASYFPDRFGGVIGRAGDVGDVGPENMSNLPTYFAGAGGQATAYHEKIKAAGHDNCTIQAEGSELDIWNWIQDHPRAANPSSVTLVPGAPFPVRAYWVRVPPSTDTTSRLDARIERESNTIHVDATGIANVTLHLNDALVDLNRPVTIICNGAETVETIPRNLKATLQMMFDAVSDSGRVFVALVPCSIPEREKGN